MNEDCFYKKNCDKTEKDLCQWWINSPEHNNCFLEYLKIESRYGGEMKESSQIEMQKLLGYTPAEMKEKLGKAMKLLKKALNRVSAKTLLTTEESPELIVLPTKTPNK